MCDRWCFSAGERTDAYDARHPDQAPPAPPGGGARERGHPLRRGFRRRDAARGGRVLQGHRLQRARLRHPSGLPVRDPGAGGHAVRRVGLPDAVLLPRGLHQRRRRRRAGGDEPGSAPGEPRRREVRRHGDREQRRLHRIEPRQGRLRHEPARRRQPRATTASSRSTSRPRPPMPCARAASPRRRWRAAGTTSRSA